MKERGSLKTRFQGHPVRPLQELSSLNENDLVVIASSAEATGYLHDDQVLLPLFHLKTLMNVFSIIDELKEPLRFEFDDFLFGRGLLPLKKESPYWHPTPGCGF